LLSIVEVRVDNIYIYRKYAVAFYPKRFYSLIEPTRMIMGVIKMLSKKDQNICETFAIHLRRHFPEAQLWAFGSRARGDGSWDSDLDICTVIAHVNPLTNDIIRDIAWKIGFENDCVITTVIMDYHQFEHGPMSESTLIENIHKEGIPL